MPDSVAYAQGNGRFFQYLAQFSMLFFGLSSLFAAPVFTGGGLGKVIRIAFLLNGLFLLLGAVGYVFQWLILLFLTVNFGMGASVFVVTTALAAWFRRRAAKSE